MWSAYLSLKTYHRRPSDDLDLDDSIAAWCVDGAVLSFGILLENALQERVNKGTTDKPRMEPKYTLMQLLDPLFRMPRPAPAPKPTAPQNGLAALMALARSKGSGVKVWATKPS